MKHTPLKLMSLSAVALLALAGCSKENSEPEMPVAEPVVTQITAVCDDFSLKNRLTDAVQANLLDASLSRLSGLSELQMQDMEAKIRNQLATVSFDAQSVANTDTGCIADIYITPSAQSLAATQNLLADSGIDLVNELRSAGGDLVAGRIVAKGVTYNIVDNKAVLDNPEHPLFVAVADLMVTAAGSSANTVGLADVATAAATGAAITAPTVAVRPQVIDRTTSSPVTTDTTASAPVRSSTSATTSTSAPKTERTEVKKSQPAPRPQAKAENKTAAKPVTKTENKSTAKPAAKPAPAPAKTDTRAATKPSDDGVTRTITKAEPKAEPKPQPKAEPKSDPKPEPKPQPKADAKPSSEITVVETNDTY